MFLLKYEPNTQIVDFGTSVDLMSSGKIDDARMFIAQTIEDSDPNQKLFAKNLESYLTHDPDFAEEAISMLELHNSQCSNDFSEPNVPVQNTPVQHVSNIPNKPSNDPIKDKLELAMAIQDVLKQQEVVHTHSHILKDKVTKFLNKELKKLFGEEVQEEFSADETTALKILAKRILTGAK